MSLRPDPIRRGVGAAVATAGLALALVAVSVAAAPDDVPAPKKGDATMTRGGPPKVGLQLNAPKAFQGYTLIAPLNGKKTYLIDMLGRVVRVWESKYTARQEAYFLENGHLLRAATLDNRERLFGGAGRKPETVPGPWLADSLVEVKPIGKTTGDVVWERHAWDQLIQDSDASKANYGEVGKHPVLIDVNFGGEIGFPGGGFPGPPPQDIAKKDAPKQDEAKKQRELDRLKTIGYVGSPTARGNMGILPDWTHVNSVAYNAEFDQMMISVRSFGEFWIIDHGTTTALAAGHTGGRRGKGGTSSTARATRSHTAPVRRRTNARSPSTTPTGSPADTPARDTSWSSTTAASAPRAITRRSTSSSSPSTRGAITRATRASRSGRATRPGRTPRQERRSCSRSSCPAPTGSPSATPSSVRA
jgi:hypothetical protein